MRTIYWSGRYNLEPTVPVTLHLSPFGLHKGIENTDDNAWARIVVQGFDKVRPELRLLEFKVPSTDAERVLGDKGTVLLISCIAEPRVVPDAGPTCRSCRFWDVIDKASPVTTGRRGECRRFPPGRHEWVPSVDASYWCGEHQPRKDAT